MADLTRARLQRIPILRVQVAALHALFADAPKRRYLVTPNQEEAEITIKGALTRIAQLNADQPYELDREQLIEMLDAAMHKVD